MRKNKRILITFVLKFNVIPVFTPMVFPPSDLASAAEVEFVWARSMGGSHYDTGFDIVLDLAGNAYTTGFFNTTADYDPGPGVFNLTSAGALDIFVSKLDHEGNFVWARSMGGSKDDIGLGIAVDRGGHVFTVGRYRGTADFDPGEGNFNLASAGFDDVFVSKFKASSTSGDGKINHLLPIIMR